MLCVVILLSFGCRAEEVHFMQRRQISLLRLYLFSCAITPTSRCGIMYELHQQVSLLVHTLISVLCSSVGVLCTGRVLKKPLRLYRCLLIMELISICQKVLDDASIAQMIYIYNTAQNRNTPLHLSAVTNSDDTMRILLHNGADINARDAVIYLTLMRATRSRNSDSAQSWGTPLQVAIRCCAVEAAVFLIEQGADINLNDKVTSCGAIRKLIDHAVWLLCAPLFFDS